MAKKIQKAARRLIGEEVGTPIFDDLGRVVGFTGINAPIGPGGTKPPYSANNPQMPSTADIAYRTSDFGRAVDGWMNQYRNYKRPLDVRVGKPINYEDGSYDEDFGTKDSNVRPKYLPPEPSAPIPAKTSGGFKRKYTSQYAPPEEQQSFQRAATTPVKQKAIEPVMKQAQSAIRNTNAVIPHGATGDWSSFVESAKRVAQESGFPLSVILGQAALETGRKHSPGNNYFGIKGSGNAGTQDLATQEATAGGEFYNTRSNFAAYKSPEDSVRAYVDLIKRRYPDAYAQKDNPDAMIGAIKAGGYATDPTYVQKVMSTPEFRQYRNGIPTPPAKPQVAASVRPALTLAPSPRPSAKLKPAPQKAAPKPAPKPVPKPVAKPKNNAFQNILAGAKTLFRL